MATELSFDEMTSKAQGGCKKFAMLSSFEMGKIKERFEHETGQIATHIKNKESFYEFCEEQL